MPLDQDLIGRPLPPVGPYEVGRAKIAEFATAIGDPDPAYRDEEAARALGHPDVVAPPTFAVIPTFAALDAVFLAPGVDLDYSRLVHGEQSFSYARPVVAGDRLYATATIEGYRLAAGNEIVKVGVDLTTSEGESVGAARLSVVIRAQEG